MGMNPMAEPCALVVGRRTYAFDLTAWQLSSALINASASRPSLRRQSDGAGEGRNVD